MVTLSDSVRDSLANQLKVTSDHIKKVLDLLSSGASPAFIARYRLDETGGLDNVKIATVMRAIDRAEELERRRAAILKSADGHPDLTEEIKSQITTSTNLQQLEDLYLPFKRKKPSKMAAETEQSLKALATSIHDGSLAAADRDTKLDALINKDVPRLADKDAVLAAVTEVIAERMSHDIGVRKTVRDALRTSAKLTCKEFVQELENEDEETATNDKTADKGKEEKKTAAPETPAAVVEEAKEASDEAATKSSAEPNPTAKVPTEKPDEAKADQVAKVDETKKGSKNAKPAKPANTAELRRQQRRESRQRKRDNLRVSFKPYFSYSEPLEKVTAPKLLAINRGERVRILSVVIQADQDALLASCKAAMVPETHPHKELLEACAKRAYEQYVRPGVERDLRRELTNRAERYAVKVFSRNMQEYLLQPPLRKRILAIDPGLRFGCKAVALDARGQLLGETTVHALGDAERVNEGRRRMAELINKHDLEVIAIGTGTGARQAETTVATMLQENFADKPICYTLVNESGTSVYSTGTLAKEELPEADPRARAAAAIGRRLIDPISELVKVEPDQIGSGAYQQDVKLKHLQAPLVDTIRECVNLVGADVNTASPVLLQFVSGLDEHTATAVAQHRLKNKPYANREEIKAVADVSEATWQQAAGFLRIYDGDEPLDATSIHPEHYEVARKIIEAAGLTADGLKSEIARHRSEELAPATPPVPPKKAQVAPTETSETPSTTSPEAKKGEAASATEEKTAEEKPTEQKPTEEKAEVADKKIEPAKPANPEKPKEVSAWAKALKALDVPGTATTIKCSEEATRRIIDALSQPGRDCRLDRAAPIMRRTSLRWEDLEPELELVATVLSVVDFGAFVDLGIRESGLVHISELGNRFIQDPHEVVSVGDSLRLWVVKVDKEKRRVSLSTLTPEERKARQEGGNRQRRGGKPSYNKSRGDQRSGNNAGKRGGGGKPRGGRNQKSHRPSTPRSYEVKPKRRKPKAPAVPITDAMKKGDEPMRTFGDLAQFFSDDKSKGDGDKKKGKKK